ncbi:MAG: hypothetical protein AB7T49_14070 [Oligoflexales bacterium]
MYIALSVLGLVGLTSLAEGNVLPGLKKCTKAGEVGCVSTADFPVIDEHQDKAVKNAESNTARQNVSAPTPVKTQLCDEQKHICLYKNESIGQVWTSDLNLTSEFSWFDAVGICADLEVGTHADWRLPTHEEITAVGVRNLEMWDSTKPSWTVESDPENAVALSVVSGQLTLAAKSLQSMGIHCVRTGP